MKEQNSSTAKERFIQGIIDLSVFDIPFTSKPLIIGGMAMAYYGLRKKGSDVDLILTNEDYQTLAQKYPNNRVDRWGDLYISLRQYECLRSIFRFDYAFLSENAVEYASVKVISPEKLFFMKVLAYENQPEVQKHVTDYKLLWDYFLKTFQNPQYVAEAMPRESHYLKAPNGTIYGGDYKML